MIDGAELIVIAGVAVVLLFWGPSQLPKLARSLGEAKREFNKAMNSSTTSSDAKKAEE